MSLCPVPCPDPSIFLSLSLSLTYICVFVSKCNRSPSCHPLNGVNGSPIAMVTRVKSMLAMANDLLCLQEIENHLIIQTGNKSVFRKNSNFYLQQNMCIINAEEKMSD